MQKARAGIIGCGQIGSLFDENSNPSEFPRTHASAYSSSAGFALTALCDIDQERLSKAKAKWSVDFATTNLEQFLEIDLDVVSVCIPAIDRVGLLSKILAQSKARILFCEKPIAVSLDEVQQISALGQRMQAKILVNYIRRFDPELRSIGRVIKSGEWGKPVKVVGHYGKGLLNNGSHMIDLLNMFFGEAKSTVHLATVADDRLGSADETESAILNYGNLPVVILAQDHVHFTTFELDLFFEKARVRISDSGRKVEYFSVMNDSDFLGYKMLGLQRTAARGLQKSFVGAMEELHGLWQGSIQVGSSSVEDSFTTFKTIAAIHKSKAQGGQEVIVRSL